MSAKTPRQYLCELINIHGTELCYDSAHCEALLNEACGSQYSHRIVPLVMAVKLGIPAELLDPPDNMSKVQFLMYLIQHLQRHAGLDYLPAAWTVYSWAMALDILSQDTDVQECLSAQHSEIETSTELTHTLRGSEYAISALAFSADSRYFASGSWDGLVKIWDAEQQIVLHTLTGATHRVVSLAFSPDGQILAAGSWDSTIILWKVSNGKQLQIINAHQDRVTAVTFSPDGQYLASASDDRTIKLWKIKSVVKQPSLQKVLHGHKSKVNTLTFNAHSNLLISGGQDRMLNLWEIA